MKPTSETDEIDYWTPSYVTPPAERKVRFGSSVARMELSAAVDFARSQNQAVLTTLRRTGLPQLSNVLHHVDGWTDPDLDDRRSGQVREPEPWAAVKVDGESFWSYVVIEGEVTLSDVAGVPDDGAVDELVALFRALSGEHPDWDEFRAAMVAERRVVVRVQPTRAYGKLG